MTAKNPPDAVPDADLVRWLDGELDDTERARVEAAVAEDPALAQRLEQLRRRARAFGTLLRAADPVANGAAEPAVRSDGERESKLVELDAAWAAQQGVEPHPVRPYRPLPAWARAAALVAFLLAASLFVPPVRAWIAGVLAPVLGRSEEAPLRGLAVPPSAAEAPIDTLSVTFVTDAAAFTIEFAAVPAAGALTVERAQSDSASASVYTAGGGEELQRIRTDLLRISNASTSTADYRVALPASVTQVTVRLPGREDGVWRIEAGAEPRRVFPLGAEPR
jgi:hypothetical protein